MANKPVLVIMAAGMGSRYGGLKQVDKITDAGEIILEALGLDAPIHAGMYLGEGSGAVMLMPLLEMARRLYGSGQTFDRLGIDAYRRFD